MGGKNRVSKFPAAFESATNELVKLNKQYLIKAEYIAHNNQWPETSIAANKRK